MKRIPWSAVSNETKLGLQSGRPDGVAMLARSAPRLLGRRPNAIAVLVFERVVDRVAEIAARTGGLAKLRAVRSFPAFLGRLE